MPHHAAKAGGHRSRVLPPAARPVRARNAVASVNHSEFVVVALGVRAFARVREYACVRTFNDIQSGRISDD